ncbi:MAG: heavy-metal-associated domain-containing protein [Phycisphaeraceae bacterium]
MPIQTLNVRGMSCEGCADRVRKSLLELPGVTDVDVSVEKSRASVDYNAPKIEPAQFLQAVRDAGYEAEIAGGISPKGS